MKALAVLVASCFRGHSTCEDVPHHLTHSPGPDALTFGCSEKIPAQGQVVSRQGSGLADRDSVALKHQCIPTTPKEDAPRPSFVDLQAPQSAAPRSGRVEYTSADELVKDVQDLRWLGQGAQGVVYEGCWQGATVAVKFSIVEDLDTTAYELLFSRLLSHPNVVQTFVAKVAVLDEKTIYSGPIPAADAAANGPVTAPGSWRRAQDHPAAAAAAAAVAGSALYRPATAPAAGACGCSGTTTTTTTAATSLPSCSSHRHHHHHHHHAQLHAHYHHQVSRGLVASGSFRAASPGPGPAPAPAPGAGPACGGGGGGTRGGESGPDCSSGQGPVKSSAGGVGGLSSRADSFHSDDGFGDPFGRRSTFTDVREVLAGMGAKPGHYITQMVMEHCDHGSLHTAIQRGIFKPTSRWGPKLALRALIRTVREVAQGMFHLHANNVLHGDLKPANVLLINSRKDRRGYIAKVSDFGLAQFCSQDHISNAPWGTLVYMAPERVLHGQLFPASDVYSFGVMLWEMYHGQRPYEGMHAAQIVMACAQGTATLEWGPDACEDVARISRRCTAPAIRDRPTFEQLMRELAHLEARVRLEGPRISTSVEHSSTTTLASASTAAALRRAATAGNPQRMSAECNPACAASTSTSAAVSRRHSHDRTSASTAAAAAGAAGASARSSVVVPGYNRLSLESTSQRDRRSGHPAGARPLQPCPHPHPHPQPQLQPHPHTPWGRSTTELEAGSPGGRPSIDAEVAGGSGRCMRVSGAPAPPPPPQPEPPRAAPSGAPSTPAMAKAVGAAALPASALTAPSVTEAATADQVLALLSRDEAVVGTTGPAAAAAAAAAVSGAARSLAAGSTPCPSSSSPPPPPPPPANRCRTCVDEASESGRRSGGSSAAAAIAAALAQQPEVANAVMAELLARLQQQQQKQQQKEKQPKAETATTAEAVPPPQPSPCFGAAPLAGMEAAACTVSGSGLSSRCRVRIGGSASRSSSKARAAEGHFVLVTDGESSDSGHVEAVVGNTRIPTAPAAPPSSLPPVLVPAQSPSSLGHGNNNQEPGDSRGRGRGDDRARDCRRGGSNSPSPSPSPGASPGGPGGRPPATPSACDGPITRSSTALTPGSATSGCGSPRSSSRLARMGSGVGGSLCAGGLSGPLPTAATAEDAVGAAAAASPRGEPCPAGVSRAVSVCACASAPIPAAVMTTGISADVTGPCLTYSSRCCSAPGSKEQFLAAHAAVLGGAVAATTPDATVAASKPSATSSGVRPQAASESHSSAGGISSPFVPPAVTAWHDRSSGGSGDLEGAAGDSGPRDAAAGGAAAAAAASPRFEGLFLGSAAAVTAGAGGGGGGGGGGSLVRRRSGGLPPSRRSSVNNKQPEFPTIVEEPM